MHSNNPATRLSHAQAIWLISQFELTRLFLTKRGIILLAAFAVVWFFILKVIILESVKLLSDPNILNTVTAWSGKVNLDYLLQWPYSELAVYWVLSAFIFPFITVLMASDQTASDAKRGTLRFLLLRTSRRQLLLGRFIGQAVIIAILILLTVIPSLLMGVIREPNDLLISLPQLFLVSGNLFIICLPFVALMALLNTVYQSSKLNILFALILLPLVSKIIGLFSFYLAPLEYLLFIFPSVQVTSSLQLADFHISSIIIPLMQIVFYLVLAQMILIRKAL